MQCKCMYYRANVEIVLNLRRCEGLLALYQKRKARLKLKSEAGFREGELNWLPDKDSNLDKLLQRQLCYRYTIGQSVLSRSL